MNSLACASGEVTLFEKTEGVHLQWPVGDAETKNIHVRYKLNTRAYTNPCYSSIGCRMALPLATLCMLQLYTIQLRQEFKWSCKARHLHSNQIAIYVS